MLEYNVKAKISKDYKKKLDNFSEDMGKGSKQRVKFYMAKVPNYVITKEKGDTEHSKVLDILDISMSGIV